MLFSGDSHNNHGSVAQTDAVDDTCRVSVSATCPEPLPAPAARRGQHDVSLQRVLRNIPVTRVRVVTNGHIIKLLKLLVVD